MFINLIKERRSIRQYQKRPVPQALIDELAKAALWAPSSRGINPWEFIVIQEQPMLAALAKAKYGAEFLAEAPLAFAVLADSSKSDVWIEDASVVSTILLLAAADLGLGACWVQIRNRMHNPTVSAEEYVAGLLNVPAQYRVCSIVGIGYPDEETVAHTDGELERKKLHQERF